MNEHLSFAWFGAFTLFLFELEVNSPSMNSVDQIRGCYFPLANKGLRGIRGFPQEGGK